MSLAMSGMALRKPQLSLVINGRGGIIYGKYPMAPHAVHPPYGRAHAPG